jgi:hypothetical protein
LVARRRPLDSGFSRSAATAPRLRRLPLTPILTARRAPKSPAKQNLIHLRPELAKVRGFKRVEFFFTCLLGDLVAELFFPRRDGIIDLCDDQMPVLARDDSKCHGQRARYLLGQDLVKAASVPGIANPNFTEHRN